MGITGPGSERATRRAGLVETLIELFRSLDAVKLLDASKKAAFIRDGTASTLPKRKITK